MITPDTSFEDLLGYHKIIYKRPHTDEAITTYRRFYNYALEQPGPVMEIGVGTGGPTSFILAAAALKKGDKFYGLDAFPGLVDGVITYGVESHLKIEKMNYEMCILDHYPNATLLVGDISELEDQLPNDISFVYIDSLHTYDQVIKETRIIYPKMVKEGWMVYDDVGWHQDEKATVYFSEVDKGGVNAAVREIARTYKFQSNESTNQKEWFKI